MDDIVKQAMHKWPNVPDCYGWLGLDERGQWFMRDDAAQARGAFSSGQAGAKGALLTHSKLMDFIARNYEVDTQGRWFFQNGPQRVFVELQATPWVWRLTPDGRIASHTGLETEYQQCLLDETGRVYLHTPLGLGLVHSLDVALAAQCIEAGHWSPQEVLAAELPERFHFVRSPQAQALGASNKRA
ncbi:MAG: DUF2946 family protein [Rhodoferax sp.]